MEMVYEVQPGDTLFLITRRFGVTVADILVANPQIASPEAIFPGQIIGIPAPGPTPPPTPGISYIVQPGDTLAAVAGRFGVSQEALLAANLQITDPNLIFPGQFITIPAGPTPPPIPPPGFTYVVQTGDTLFVIARRFGVNLSDLIAANADITDPNRLSPGQLIRIPTGTLPPPPPGGSTYVVQPGDTLLAIARRFGISRDDLLAANPQIATPNLIFPGQLIIIPPV
jgi:tyrosinase